MIKNNNKHFTIRPSNVTNLVFLLLSAMFIVFSVLMLNSFFFNILNKKLFHLLFPLFSILGIWIGILFLSIAATPKIKLFSTYIEITHWKYGLPYNGNLNSLYKLPKSKKTKISYDDFKMYGVFFTKDIKEYLQKSSGFLSDQWMIIMSASVPIPIKLPKVLTGLREVMLFVNIKGESTIIDVGTYGRNQIELLLLKLERCTQTKSCGRVKPRYHINNYFFNLFKALAVVMWLTVLPISTIWLEALLNHIHVTEYQSIWRTIYVVSILLANLCIVGFISVLKEKEDVDAKRIRSIFKIAFVFFYALFIVAFVLSVFTV